MTISFALKPGVSLGEATDEIEDAAKHNLPATITGTFQGTAKVFQDSMQNMGILLIVAIAVVYIVLGVLYESYVHPLTILSGLPSAGFGALLTLILFKVDLNIYSFVGLIMLIGIVKKNAIMQIDFALEAERKEGKSPAEAIYEGCLIRFRPIMMTTMAALLGALADRAGLGRGRRSAQAARPRRGRRPGILAVDDALSDPGGLHLHGGSPRKVERMEGRARDAQGRDQPRHAGGQTVGPTMNISADLYRAAHRHQPADGRHRAVRQRGLSLAAGQRSAERRFPDPAGHRQLCPARVRRPWPPPWRRRSRISSPPSPAWIR